MRIGRETRRVVDLEVEYSEHQQFEDLICFISVHQDFRLSTKPDIIFKHNLGLWEALVSNLILKRAMKCRG